MKKFFVFLILVTLVASGCVAIPVGGSGGGSRLYVLYQVGVVARVVNNCAPHLELETVSGVVVKDLPYGSSTTIPLISLPLSGNSRQVTLTVKGYTDKREYLGSMTKIFYVSTYDGSREEVWEVDRLNLPRGRGGCR
ncbi:MAG: hypothetical protein Q7K26_03260 [bacterium]|nr:hypothetical protein [bacterium]